MNSNMGKRSSGSSSSFDFDLGLGTSQGRALNGQKSQTGWNSEARPAWQPGKPSWTHQPAAKQTRIRSEIGSGPTSMVGDIHGKTWGSSSGSGSGIGIVNKDPSLFGDLVGSAIGKSVPLKKAPPASAPGANKSPYSLGNLADSLPKSGNAIKRGGGAWGGQKAPSLGGQSMKSTMSGSNQSGSGLPLNSDPFASLVGFGSKSSGSDAFGDFQNPPKSNTGGFTSSFNASGIDFGANDDDPLSIFSASNTSSAAPQRDDWGFSSFDGGADSGGGSTTELDGLPPPPPGVSASSAKGKGIDNQRQGQYADAIKWLSWALILMDKAGDEAGSAELLSTRASCYKEVGEYNKAVSDCTKVLDHDKKNVTILVQRALLYESMEKYKLGAEDLRMVLKIDPGNRIARSTVHRLTKMAG